MNGVDLGDSIILVAASERVVPSRLSPALKRAWDRRDEERTCTHPDCSTKLSRYNDYPTCNIHTPGDSHD
jgi:hypothetical protein